VNARTLLLLIPATFCIGCLELGEDGLELVPRVPYESEIQSVGEPLVWHGEPLDVSVERGFVEVIGDPDASELVVTARALTWARYGDIDDARSINDAILDTASVSLSDGIVRVHCDVVDDDRGSAQAEATQCNVRVVVPAPPGATQELRLRTGLGDAFLQRLTTSPGGKLDLEVGGLVEAWELRANVVSSAGAHDLEITPLAGGFVDVTSTIALAAGSSTSEGATDAKDLFGTILRLPPDFATESLVLFSTDGEVTTPGFPDLAPAATSRPGESPASLIRATAEWGHVQLFTLPNITSRSRTSPLGTVVTKP
jgi:hypothetical protein